MARNKRGTLLSLSGPHPKSDVSIARSESGNLELDRSEFNEQRQYFEKGSSILDWDGGPFHLGSEIVMAAWICGEMEAERLVFVGELPPPSPLVPSAVSEIVEAYGLPLSFTHSSDLVRALNSDNIEPDLKEDDKTMNYPYRVEPLEGLAFSNKFTEPVFQEADSVEVVRDRRDSSPDTEVTVRWGEGRYGKDSDFRFIRSASRDLLKLPRTRVVFFSRDVEKCVEICEGYHSIYLPSDEVKEKLSRIKRSELSKIEGFSLATKAVLVVAMASSYESFETFGVLDDVSNEERQFLKRIESIQHA